MKWLTREYINEKALKSPQDALGVTCEHWQQFNKATATELRQAMNSGKVGWGILWCGLCMYKNAQHDKPCRTCLGFRLCCGKLHRVAESALGKWYRDKSVPYKAVEQAVRKLCIAIEELQKTIK